ncbi:hypothetical protein HPB47_000207 [Ixodes persulcatus]|uniref:Uncharacterized protein n=1 Tax=Ixodes persulcatus TaxID=34615 RepID=A0AC60PSU4_IXOPE|nr:hypothetical protein HPB47_000207 [Ixodes persulcatus]
MLLQCNALSMVKLLQEVLLHFGKHIRDVCMLVSDSASYMRKLYQDLCQSDLRLTGIHLSNACHLLNNVLAEAELWLEGHRQALPRQPRPDLEAKRLRHKP